METMQDQFCFSFYTDGWPDVWCRKYVYVDGKNTAQNLCHLDINMYISRILIVNLFIYLLLQVIVWALMKKQIDPQS